MDQAGNRFTGVPFPEPPARNSQFFPQHRLRLVFTPEVHNDECFYLDRLTVQYIRTISPLPYRLESRAGEQGMTADHAEALNRAVLGDDGVQFYLAACPS